MSFAESPRLDRRALSAGRSVTATDPRTLSNTKEAGTLCRVPASFCQVRRIACCLPDHPIPQSRIHLCCLPRAYVVVGFAVLLRCGSSLLKMVYCGKRARPEDTSAFLCTIWHPYHR